MNVIQVQEEFMGKMFNAAGTERFERVILDASLVARKDLMKFCGLSEDAARNAVYDAADMAHLQLACDGH